MAVLRRCAGGGQGWICAGIRVRFDQPVSIRGFYNPGAAGSPPLDGAAPVNYYGFLTGAASGFELWQSADVTPDTWWQPAALTGLRDAYGRRGAAPAPAMRFCTVACVHPNERSRAQIHRATEHDVGGARRGCARTAAVRLARLPARDADRKRVWAARGALQRVHWALNGDKTCLRRCVPVGAIRCTVSLFGENWCCNCWCSSCCETWSPLPCSCHGTGMPLELTHGPAQLLAPTRAINTLHLHNTSHKTQN